MDLQPSSCSGSWIRETISLVQLTTQLHSQLRNQSDRLLKRIRTCPVERLNRDFFDLRQYSFDFNTNIWSIRSFDSIPSLHYIHFCFRTPVIVFRKRTHERYHSFESGVLSKVVDAHCRVYHRIWLVCLRCASLHVTWIHCKRDSSLFFWWTCYWTISNRFLLTFYISPTSITSSYLQLSTSLWCQS